jgi:hypothetical protein
MFGCYRKSEANDPETYVAAIAAVLSEYPADVVQWVTDPRRGIPRKLRWPPNPAEVVEACEWWMTFSGASQRAEIRRKVEVANSRRMRRE